jgi:hypothetical protein
MATLRLPNGHLRGSFPLPNEFRRICGPHFEALLRKVLPRSPKYLELSEITLFAKDFSHRMPFN